MTARNGRTALVTGATGAIGPVLVGRLVERGYTVRGLSLDSPAPGLLPDGTDCHVGDIADARLLERAMRGVDCVFHLAALLHVLDPSRVREADFERVNVAGTAQVVEAALRARSRRLVFFSTIAVYGPTNGQTVSEETVPAPDTAYARSKLAAESVVLAARRDGTPFATVLRPAAVYGRRVKGNYLRLARALHRGRFVPVGPGRNRRTLVYDQDLAAAAVLAAEAPTAAGRIYNVSDGAIHPLAHIIDIICAALGRRPPAWHVPLAPARVAAGFVDALSGAWGLRGPSLRAALDKYVEDVAVESRRIGTELGFVPGYDLAAGWRATVQAWRLGQLFR